MAKRRSSTVHVAWKEELHPRDNKGQFTRGTPGTGWLAKLETKMAAAGALQAPHSRHEGRRQVWSDLLSQQMAPTPAPAPAPTPAAAAPSKVTPRGFGLEGPIKGTLPPVHKSMVRYHMAMAEGRYADAADHLMSGSSRAHAGLGAGVPEQGRQVDDVLSVALNDAAGHIARNAPARRGAAPADAKWHREMAAAHTKQLELDMRRGTQYDGGVTDTSAPGVAPGGPDQTKPPQAEALRAEALRVAATGDHNRIRRLAASGILPQELSAKLRKASDSLASSPGYLRKAAEAHINSHPWSDTPQEPEAAPRPGVSAAPLSRASSYFSDAMGSGVGESEALSKYLKSQREGTLGSLDDRTLRQAMGAARGSTEDDILAELQRRKASTPALLPNTEQRHMDILAEIAKRGFVPRPGGITPSSAQRARYHEDLARLGYIRRNGSNDFLTDKGREAMGLQARPKPAKKAKGASDRPGKKVNLGRLPEGYEARDSGRVDYRGDTRYDLYGPDGKVVGTLQKATVESHTRASSGNVSLRVAHHIEWRLQPIGTTKSSDWATGNTAAMAVGIHARRSRPTGGDTATPAAPAGSSSTQPATVVGELHDQLRPIFQEQVRLAADPGRSPQLVEANAKTYGGYAVVRAALSVRQQMTRFLAPPARRHAMPQEVHRPEDLAPGTDRYLETQPSGDIYEYDRVTNKRRWVGRIDPGSVLAIDGAPTLPVHTRRDPDAGNRAWH